MDSYSTIRNNEIISPVRKQMELNTKVLSEISQTRTSITCFFSYGEHTLHTTQYMIRMYVCDIKVVGSYVERGRETVKSRGSWERVMGTNIFKYIIFLSRNVITHHNPFIQSLYTIPLYNEYIFTTNGGVTVKKQSHPICWLILHAARSAAISPAHCNAQCLHNNILC